MTIRSSLDEFGENYRDGRSVLDEGNDEASDMRFYGRGALGKKFNRRPVAPTISRNKPFGKYIEGLSHCETKGYVITTPVQTKKTPFSFPLKLSILLIKTFPSSHLYHSFPNLWLTPPSSAPILVLVDRTWLGGYNPSSRSRQILFQAVCIVMIQQNSATPRFGNTKEDDDIPKFWDRYFGKLLKNSRKIIMEAILYRQFLFCGPHYCSKAGSI
jgi:hypothetical protein